MADSNNSDAVPMNADNPALAPAPPPAPASTDEAAPASAAPPAASAAPPTTSAAAGNPGQPPASLPIASAANTARSVTFGPPPDPRLPHVSAAGVAVPIAPPPPTSTAYPPTPSLTLAPTSAHLAALLSDPSPKVQRQLIAVLQGASAQATAGTSSAAADLLLTPTPLINDPGNLCGLVSCAASVLTSTPRSHAAQFRRGGKH